MLSHDATYLAALAATLLTEAPIVWLGLRAGIVAGARLRFAAVFIAANLFTHGALWLAWDHLPGAYAHRLVAAEIAVWLLEALLFRALLGVRLARVLVVAALANAVSTFAGLLLWRLLLYQPW